MGTNSDEEDVAERGPALLDSQELPVADAVEGDKETVRGPGGLTMASFAETEQALPRLIAMLLQIYILIMYTYFESSRFKMEFGGYI